MNELRTNVPNPPMAGDPARIRAVLEKSRSKTCCIRLESGETAWNPASTSRPIYGPCDVTYRLHSDGGIDAEIN